MPPARTSLSVMTFNLLYSNRDFAAMGAAIRASHPDVLGIQEVERSQMTALQKLLRNDYPYAQFHKPEREAGVGLFSRFPITAADSFPLPPRQLALRATVMVLNDAIDVLVVHLSPNRALQSSISELPASVAAHYATQAGEMAFIKRALVSTNRPALLLCDCNMADTSQAYAMLAAQMRDSFREAGWGFGHTYPAGPLPLQRYDYIWHSAEFVAERAEVGPSGGSDHFPVVARLRLAATGGAPPGRANTRLSGHDRQHNVRWVLRVVQDRLARRAQFGG